MLKKQQFLRLLKICLLSKEYLIFPKLNLDEARVLYQKAKIETDNQKIEILKREVIQGTLYVVLNFIKKAKKKKPPPKIKRKQTRITATCIQRITLINGWEYLQLIKIVRFTKWMVQQLLSYRQLL